MSKSKNFPQTLNILLDTDTARMLEALQENGRVSRGHVIRQAIRNAHAMLIDERPTCASGSQCHCPHTHTFAARPVAALNRAV